MYFLFASRSSFSDNLMSIFCSLIESANSTRVCNLEKDVKNEKKGTYGSSPNMPNTASLTIFSIASFTALLSLSMYSIIFHNI